MLKQVMSQIKSEHWFVTIDLKDVYFHISILPTHREFLRFCFRGRSLPISGSSFRPSTLTPHFYKVCGCCVSSVAATKHPHTQLYRRLVDSRSIRADGGSTLSCCSSSHESVGLRLNAKKSVLSPALRTTYLGVGWDSTTMQARMSPAQIESILTAVVRVRGGQSLTVKLRPT